MAGSDLAQAVLDEIRKLGSNFDRIDLRLDALERRFDARFDGVEALFDAVDARFDAVDARFEAVDARFERVESRLSSVEDLAADNNARLKALPDMNYLAGLAKVQVAQSREIKAEIADLKTRMDEVFQSMATGPEIHNLRSEVSHFRDQNFQFEVRLTVVETKLGLTPPSVITDFD